MAPFLFTCPVTRLKVQHWSDDDDPPEDQYDEVDLRGMRRRALRPGVGHLTALAFTAAVDDPERFRRSRDLGAYLGLVPRRYQSGEIDYTGGISKCGDRRMRTLLYEAANFMLTRYKGPLKLKDWALAIAKRSTLRKARIALARRLAIIMHAMLRHGTDSNRNRSAPTMRPKRAPRWERRPREGVDDGADSVACGRSFDRLRFQPSRSAPS
jgi:hypothetical protein